MSKQELQGVRNWYAIHTYAGYENAVLRNLRQRIDSLGMHDKIFNMVAWSEPLPKKKYEFGLLTEIMILINV